MLTLSSKNIGYDIYTKTQPSVEILRPSEYNKKTNQSNLHENRDSTAENFARMNAPHRREDCVRT